MKLLGAAILVAVLLFFVAKNGYGVYSSIVADASDSGYHQGYAQAQARYAPVADPQIATFVRAFCDLDAATILAGFAPEAGVVEADVTTFVSNQHAAGKTCTQTRFLGVLHHSTNSEWIYAVRVNDVDLWYIFTADNSSHLVVQIQ